MKSAGGAVARFVVFDLLGSFLWFPIWWYTIGVGQVVKWIGRSLKYRLRAYGFKIWIQNFFVPMYGQGDLVGKLISIMMRTAVLIVRSVAIAIEALVYALGLLFWILTPLAIILLIVINITASFSV